MGLTRQHAHAVIATYIKAWETQDPDLICTIFTPAATYHERVLADLEKNIKIARRAAIRAGLAFAGKAKAGTFIDPGGNIDL